jgi:DNA-binding GntR family transcriptional regulator
VIIMEGIKDGPEPKYAQLAAILRERIASGELAVGEPVPSETELEQEFDLARGTIRKAIGVLRDEGLIVTTKGKGSWVVEQPPASGGETGGEDEDG